MFGYCLSFTYGFTYTVFNLLFFTPVVGKEILVLFTAVLVTIATKYLRNSEKVFFDLSDCQAKVFCSFTFKSGNYISKHDRKRVFYHIEELKHARF